MRRQNDDEKWRDFFVHWLINLTRPIRIDDEEAPFNNAAGLIPYWTWRNYFVAEYGERNVEHKNPVYDGLWDDENNLDMYLPRFRYRGYWTLPEALVCIHENPAYSLEVDPYANQND